MPVPAVNAKVEISDSLSLEGFYQIRWAHTEIEPAGTFFSTNDILGPGGDIAHTGFGLPNRADDRDGAPDPGCPGPHNGPQLTQFVEFGRSADYAGPSSFGYARRRWPGFARPTGMSSDVGVCP